MMCFHSVVVLPGVKKKIAVRSDRGLVTVGDQSSGSGFGFAVPTLYVTCGVGSYFILVRCGNCLVMTEFPI